MVGVAQLVESRIVIPVVVGSSPIFHPIIFLKSTRQGAFFVSIVQNPVDVSQENPIQSATDSL